MSPASDPFGFVDTLIAIGLLGAAVMGIWFFLSSSLQEEKRREWEEKGEMKAVSEWGEWLWAVFAIVLLIAQVSAWRLVRVYRSFHNALP